LPEILFVNLNQIVENAFYFLHSQLVLLIFTIPEIEQFSQNKVLGEFFEIGLQMECTEKHICNQNCTLMPGQFKMVFLVFYQYF
jgi:hypothetical protein